MDSDNDGSLTVDELEAHLEDDLIKNLLISLDISVSDALTLFKLLESSDDRVNAEEFALGLMQLKGVAKRTDVVELKHKITRLSSKLENLLTTIEVVAQDVASVKSRADKFDRSLSTALSYRADAIRRPVPAPMRSPPAVKEAKFCSFPL